MDKHKKCTKTEKILQCDEEVQLDIYVKEGIIDT
jgi:hypothetical protein